MNNMERFAPVLATLIAVSGVSPDAEAAKAKKKPGISAPKKQRSTVEDKKEEVDDEGIDDDDELKELEGEADHRGLRRTENPFDDDNVSEVLRKCDGVRKGLSQSSGTVATALACDSYKYLEELRSSKKTKDGDERLTPAVCNKVEFKMAGEAARGCLGKEVSALARCVYDKAVRSMQKHDDAEDAGAEDGAEHEKEDSKDDDTEDGKLKGDFAKLNKCSADVLTLEKDIVRLSGARKHVLRGIIQLKEDSDSAFYGKRASRKAKERALIQKAKDVLKRHKQ